MPYYPMKCCFSSCGLEFDYFTKPALYRLSEADSFRDVRCFYCGSFGSVKRAWPADSAPANITVKGTWGKNASPELKGRDYSSKQERDRQLAEIGRSHQDDGEDRSAKKSSSVTTYTRVENGEIQPVVKAARPEPRPVVVDDRAKTPSDHIRDYAAENMGLVDFEGLARKTGLDKRRLQGGIVSAVRIGWLEKTTVERTYRLL